MTESLIIIVGCHVEGSYGPLKLNLKFKHRIRESMVGTVIFTEGCHKWIDVFY